MAINPPSDIVLDVARAADPETYRSAVERLARLRETAAGEHVFTLPAEPRLMGLENRVAPDATAASPLSAGIAPTRRRLDAYGQFEAFVLQTFLQSMLPDNATATFGKGSAGAFWRSMLAEKLGDELARSGQVGIAQRLAAAQTRGASPTDLASETRNGVPPANWSAIVIPTDSDRS